MASNIRDTDVTILAILDGHGGEFAAVFAKDQLMNRLCKKIEEAIDISAGKLSPVPRRRGSILLNKIDLETNDEDDEKKTDEPPKTPVSQRRNKLKKALSQDDDCNPPKTNCNQDRDDSFLSKLSSIRLTKESFLKPNNKIVKPEEHDAGHYVDRHRKINFGKMVTDLVLLTDYELIEKAKKQVRLRAIITHFLFPLITFLNNLHFTLKSSVRDDKRLN